MGDMDGNGALVIVAAVYAVLIAVLLATLRKSLALAPMRAVDVGFALAGCGAAYGITAGLTWLVDPAAWAKALSILAAMGADDGRLAAAGLAPLALGLVRACVLAPVGEELLFRGALFGWLRRKLPAPGAIVITAAAFTVIHGYPAIFPLAFALGLALGWARERSGSVFPSIAAHAVHNIAMVAASFVFTGWSARLPAWGAA